MLLSNLKKRNA